MTSSSLSTTITKADILPGFKTDHSLITLHLTNNTNPRGPGFWKLNTSFLLESEYINLIKETINEVANDYKNDNEVDSVLLWDTMKLQIRSSSLHYAKKKKAKMKSQETSLEVDILALQRKLEENNFSETEKTEILNELDVKILQKEEISKLKIQGTIIRSKSRWYNEGEKNTKYFLNLEKRHFNKKTIKSLQLADNSIIKTDSEILKEAESFYRQLYSSCSPQVDDTYANIFFPEENTVMLDEQEQNECVGLLTEAECLESLKSMESNKSPESDGLPAEFYKIFWNDVHHYLLNALNCAYAKGLLAVSQRRGLITLLPKKNKPANFLKNWRPITLLNCDYKIATKSIASRLRKVIPRIINHDQTGFLKNRFIGENIRLLDSIINYTDTEQIPGLLLFVDFEKAFDSVEWSFIEKTLKYYNFGPSLIAWIKLFYTDISSCIQNNGWASEFFTLGRGVRQSCPLFPYLFILCAEILGNAVRNDEEVHGIMISGSECKIPQYADDTTMILDGSQSSFSRTLYLFDAFGSMSGLKVNSDKTESLWIGSSKNSNSILFSNKQITWAKGKVNALGVWFSTLEENAFYINFSEKIERIKSIVNSWSARRLILLGKITIIKSLAVSQIVHVLSALPTHQGALKEINTLLYDFLWNGKGDKIKRTEMINDYDKGGLKMIDIHSFNKSLKMKWVQGYLNNVNHGKWKLFLDFHLQKYGGKVVFLSNLKPQDVPQLNLRDPFLREILEHWTTLNYTETNLDFNSMGIWHNSLIRIENRPFFYTSWLKAGVKEVRDLLNQDQTFLSYNAFVAKYNIKTNYLEYFKVIAALQQFKKVCLPALDNPSTDGTVSLLSHSNINKESYKRLVQNKASIPLQIQEKWLSEKDIGGNSTVNWQNAYYLPFLCTRETKLRVFQFKFLHRRMATNDFLCKIGIKQVDSCSFCEETTETLVHLFWNCKYTQAFWKKLLEWMSQNIVNLKDSAFSPFLCLGLVENVSNVLLHHLLLIARHYIYTCKLKNSIPKLQVYLQLLLTSMKIEKKIALDNSTLNSFERKCSPLKDALHGQN